MSDFKIFLVDNKRVAIIKSNTHTYNIRFVKSGKFMEVHKKYVVSYTPKPSSSKPIPQRGNQQIKLNFTN